jgi:hypothetical protein
MCVADCWLAGCLLPDACLMPGCVHVVTALYSTVQQCTHVVTALYSTVQQCTAVYSSVQQCTVLYCTAVYSSVHMLSQHCTAVMH